jgi:hypothetical protein
VEAVFQISDEIEEELHHDHETELTSKPVNQDAKLHESVVACFASFFS